MAEIGISGAAPEPNAAPAEVLARVLLGFQNAVYVIAATRSNISPNIRFRISELLREAYTLQCLPLEPGSLAIPVLVSGRHASGYSGIAVHSEDLLDDVYRGLAAIKNADAAQLKDVLPDSILRARFLREFKDALPASGEPWAVRFRNGHDESISLDAFDTRIIEQWITTPEIIEDSMTVIGDLIRIDFAERAIWIKYKPNNKALRCSYDIEIESDILADRDVPIQLSGIFILDDEGFPQSLSNVYQIESVNLAPFEYSRLTAASGAFAFEPKLILKPTLTPDQQLFIVSDPALGIDAYGATRKELEAEIAVQVGVLWDEIVQSTEPLDAGAEALAVALKSRITRV